MLLVTDNQRLEPTRARVEHHVVYLSKLVTELAWGSLADEVQLPVYGGLFVVVDGHPEGGPKPLRADRDEVILPGEAFYMAPGHAPAAEAGTEFVQFSPSDELAVSMSVMAKNVQELQARTPA